MNTTEYGRIGDLHVVLNMWEHYDSQTGSDVFDVRATVLTGGKCYEAFVSTSYNAHVAHEWKRGMWVLRKGQFGFAEKQANAKVEVVRLVAEKVAARAAEVGA